MTSCAYWRCFHCDAMFANNAAGRKGAARHFGAVDDTPVCKIEEWHWPIAAYVRELNEELSRYRAEDSDILRAVAAKAMQHGQELRSAEEAGYAKAIGDIKTLLVPMVVNHEQWDRFINGRKGTSNVELQQSNEEGVGYGK